MTCQCICKCTNEACQEPNRVPELCLECNLMDALGNPRHELPDKPTVWKPIEPSVPITDEQKDAAIQNWVAENGF